MSLGSGIIISDNGYILTNEHVSGSKYSKCYVNVEGENTEYQGKVIWSDSDIDLSIIKIEKRLWMPDCFPYHISAVSQRQCSAGKTNIFL